MASKSFARRLAAGLRKPPGVIAFRVVQALKLGWMRYGRSWPRLDRSIENWWNLDRAARYAAEAPTYLVAPDAPETLRRAAGDGLLDSKSLLDNGRRLQERRFQLLGARIPPDKDFPWHSDWRFNHHWKPRYYGDYEFYRRDETSRYDIKIPWELSRLGYIPPILQNAVFDEGFGWIDAGLKPVRLWARSNPLAYSVAWYPMEASIRTVHLVFMLELIRVIGWTHMPDFALLLRLISSHGEFVWRNREYSDIRGNHYAANIASLALSGSVLADWYPAARKWLDFASTTLETEIELQFLADGIHFEKSIPYHRLVAELFLLAVVSLHRAGRPVTQRADQRLHDACLYAASYTRPDSLTPNVGDNDDGNVLSFDPLSLRNHQSLIGAAAAWWCDSELRATCRALPATMIWLLGTKGLETWLKLKNEGLPNIRRHFPQGGVAIVREQGAFMWMDIGEVGLAGRGGHGHNDILSFEAALRNQPIVVDPGSLVYTGNPKARDLFRSTRYQNGLEVDGLEIAPMGTMWEIADTARPTQVEVRMEDDFIKVRAGHTGYLRLQDPVLHVRELSLDRRRETLCCYDSLQCAEEHDIRRFLHLEVGIQVRQQNGYLALNIGSNCWRLHYDDLSEVRLEKGWISPGYGVKQEAIIVEMHTRITGSASLEFTLRPDEEKLN